MRLVVISLLAVLCCSTASAWAAPKKKPSVSAIKKTAPAFPANTAPSAPEPAGAAEANAPGLRGPTRIEFDDRLIQGQSNKSGAVYLYDRKELKVRSMVKKRENFREEIVGSLYDS